jgi:hypothetical protein
VLVLTVKIGAQFGPAAGSGSPTAVFTTFASQQPLNQLPLGDPFDELGDHISPLCAWYDVPNAALEIVGACL